MDVVTTDQVNYHRLVADKQIKSSERWERTFSWYPGRQKIEFSRVAQIYCESQHIYGNDQFLKYAREKRLNKLHAYDPEESMKLLEKLQETDSINSQAKVPPTTNGEYGRFKPTRRNFC